jgi:3-hydroxyisobutyrate dehydrogenase-like beta-hydroxyacid dehydrogenase
VYWASAGRSPQTRERAAKHGLRDAGTIAKLCETCAVIVSVCPPGAASEVAEEVIAHGFRGLFVDANAISPTRTADINRRVTAAGASFVDGGIVGGPAWSPGTTWLYLSGPRAEEVAGCFASGPLGTRIIGPEPGRASALKMCYAAYAKGTTALMAAMLATAEHLGVRGEVYAQWARDEAGSVERAEQRVRQAGAKAWRFIGEMEEIASTFRDAGLPADFHEGAGEVYRRLAPFKNMRGDTPFGDLLTALCASPAPTVRE